MNKHVVFFRLFTDGRDGLLGRLHQMGETVAVWQLELDTADANIFSQDLAEVMDYMHTLIHEFGHLLTLNTTQIVFYQFPELVAYQTEIRSKLPFIPKAYLENYNRSGKRQLHQHPHRY